MLRTAPVGRMSLGKVGTVERASHGAWEIIQDPDGWSIHGLSVGVCEASWCSKPGAGEPRFPRSLWLVSLGVYGKSPADIPVPKNNSALSFTLLLLGFVCTENWLIFAGCNFFIWKIKKKPAFPFQGELPPMRVREAMGRVWNPGRQQLSL